MTSDDLGAAAAPSAPSRPARCFGSEVILVTGYPGQRARCLVDVLAAREPDAELWLVVPASKIEMAARALSSAGHPIERLRLIPGEPCAIDLGVSRHVYSELVQRVNRWFSLYQTTDSRVRRELCFRTNLGTAREIVELCQVARRLAQVTVLSSSIVFGNRERPADEDSLQVGQTFPHAAAESLAVAEAVLRRKLALVPLIMARTPQVLGPRAGGGAPRPSGLHRLLALVASAPSDIVLPLPPGAAKRVHALPADFVAEALYAAAALGTRGHTYHFADGDAPPLSAVLQAAALHFGRRFEATFDARALGRLLLKSPGFWLAPQSSRALSEWAERATLASSAGAKLLERAQLSPPPLLDYVPSVLHETEQLLKDGQLETSSTTPFEAVA